MKGVSAWQGGRRRKDGRRATGKVLRFDGLNHSGLRVVPFDHTILRHRGTFTQSGILRLRRLWWVVLVSHRPSILKAEVPGAECRLRGSRGSAGTLGVAAANSVVYSSLVAESAESFPVLA